MNWRRELFRLWIVGTALFVIAVAYFSYSQYSEMKAEFDAAASKPVIDARAADAIYKRFYSDMAREQFDKKVATADPVTEHKVIAQLKAIITQLDTSRPLPQWTNDELLTRLM